MTKSNRSFEHGSVDVWNELFENLDLSYTENSDTQGKLFEMVKVSFLDELFPKGNLRMLEVGSGTGFVSLYFAKRGYRVTLLDTSSEILEAAKKNFQKEKALGDFVVGNAEELPFRENEFDIVMSFGLLEHFENPKKVIGEMSRVLKVGGFFFADIVPKRFSCQFFGNIFNALVSSLYWTLKAKPRLGILKAKNNFFPNYYENKFSVSEYKRFFKESGLKSIEARGNRPFPRLTLSNSLDKLYTRTLKLFIPLWKKFDRSDNFFPLFWGAGWWFWAKK